MNSLTRWLKLQQVNDTRLFLFIDVVVLLIFCKDSRFYMELFTLLTEQLELITYTGFTLDDLTRTKLARANLALCKRCWLELSAFSPC